MSLIFLDSFDHYLNIADKWDLAGTDCTIRTGGQARTGIGCLQINSGAFGPLKVIRQVSNVLAATNWHSNADGIVFLIGNQGIQGQQGACIQLVVNPDRSIKVLQGVSRTSGLLGTSAPGLVTFNAYNSIAVQTQISTTATIKVWCNGVLVLTLTNKDTTNAHNPTRLFADSVELMGPGGIPVCFHDDVYILDCTDAIHNTFLGASRIYAAVPFADVSVQWTPLGGGTNFSEVDEIPPDNDTSYVSSATVGQVDQYSYNPTGVPAAAQIQAVQHVLDMRVDSGSRSVGSDVAGVAGTGVALTSTYAMTTAPYDTNPGTGLAWVAGDFPLAAGPIVTA